MLTRLLHSLVAQPRIYDLSQALLGARQVRRRVVALCRTQRAALPAATIVLDLGGGTGLLRDCWPAGDAYICLDSDAIKLHGFRTKYPADMALLADATRLPLKDDSVDFVLCSNVTHHLTDAELARLISESARVLKREGRLVLADAVWAPRRRAGRLLWKYDRGSFPRTAETLQKAIGICYSVTHWESFAVHHQYVLCAAAKLDSV